MIVSTYSNSAFFSAKHFNVWITQEIPLPIGLQRFQIKVIRGGKTYQHEKGDVCFDDFEIELRDCHLGELRKRANHDITGITSLSRHNYSFNTNQRHRVPLRFRGGLVY